MNPTTDEVLADPTAAAPPGAVITSIIAIYEYVVPGEDDDLARGPFLVFTRDMECGIWKHLGMLEAITNDLRLILGQSNPANE